MKRRQRGRRRAVFVTMSFVLVAAALLYVYHAVRPQAGDVMEHTADSVRQTGGAEQQAGDAMQQNDNAGNAGQASLSNPQADGAQPAEQSGQQAEDDGKTAGQAGNDGQSGDKAVSAAASAAGAGALESFLSENAPSRTIKLVSASAATGIVTNAASTIVLVNKLRHLPSDYEPKDLTVPNVPFSFSGDNPKKQLRKVAAEALEKLFAAAKKDGVSLKAVSGYRSYATQKAIFSYNAKLKGADAANQTSARPGESEHQTGLAMDVSSAGNGYELEENFAETKEGKWLKAHVAEYGFIIRFPEGKEKITGYSYEPWHIRYVGVDIAKPIMSQNLTLEEFLQQNDR